MMQKLITVGNSKALTISSAVLKQIGNTDVAKVEFDPKKKRLTVDFDREEIVEEAIDLEVYETAKNLMKRYEKAFAELAKR